MTRLTDAELAELAGGITPGPWTKGLRLIIRRVYKDDQGRRVTRFIAEGLGFAGRDDQSEPEANAQAIARVPDLLADLIAAREALRKIADQGPSVSNETAVNIATEALGE